MSSYHEKKHEKKLGDETQNTRDYVHYEQARNLRQGQTAAFHSCPCSVQLLSRVWLCDPWMAACQASLSITNSPSLLKLILCPLSSSSSNNLILCHSLLLLPSIFPSIRGFSNESVLRIRWPKYWSFSFNMSPSNEYSGMISFRMDWLNLLAVQGTLKSLLQYHSSKASILQHSAFFIVQLSHPHMTPGKTIALTRQTFVGKVMSLLFNMLSRLVIAFLPRSKHLLISWLQSPSAVILEPPQNKVWHCFPSIWHEVMGSDAMILTFWMLSFKPTFSLSSFTFIRRLFSSSLSAIRVVSSAYLRLLIILPAVLIPACASSSPAFLMMYSEYKLNKQGDNIPCWSALRGESVQFWYRTFCCTNRKGTCFHFRGTPGGARWRRKWAKRKEGGGKKGPCCLTERRKKTPFRRDKYKDFLWKLKDLFNLIPE